MMDNTFISYLLMTAIGTGAIHLILVVIGTRLIRRKTGANRAMSELPFVSILVAARNEEELFPYCIRSLCAQDYPENRIEIILVDDQSDDRTADIIHEMAAEDARIIALSSNESSGLIGKAAALHTAVLRARGEFILITDADCTPPSPWVKNMVCQMQEEDIGVICGVTAVSNHDLFSGIQALDWLLLLATASAASEAGFPLTGMGNNMCLRKTAYDSVGGYPGIPDSVTEDYALFKAIHATGIWRSVLRIDPYLVNFTAPVKNFKDLWEQRQRWAKGGFYAHPYVRVLMALIFFAQLIPTIGLFLFPLPAVILILLKALGDAILTRVAQKQLRIHVPFRYFAVFELFLIGYLLAIPFSVLFVKRISWKGRTYWPGRKRTPSSGESLT